MAAKEIVVKKYIVRLSCGERSLLATLIRKGSSLAHRLLKCMMFSIQQFANRFLTPASAAKLK